MPAFAGMLKEECFVAILRCHKLTAKNQFPQRFIAGRPGASSRDCVQHRPFAFRNSVQINAEVIFGVRIPADFSVRGEGDFIRREDFL